MDLGALKDMSGIRQKASEKLAKKQVDFLFNFMEIENYSTITEDLAVVLSSFDLLLVYFSFTGSLLRQSFIILQGHGMHALFHV